jgi:hypothetical protein
MSADKLLEEEYKWFFENKDSASSQYEALNPLYAIFINNNLPLQSGMIYGSTQEACDFCSKSHKGTNCLFDFKDTATMK